MKEIHVCNNISGFPINKFHQLGKGKGKKILIIGESPAPNGWRVSGIACYNPQGKLLATGKRLNELLYLLNLSVESCGFTELSKCVISDRKKLTECCKKCYPILLKQIKGKEYKLLIILGVHTTKIFSDIIKTDLDMGKLVNLSIGGKEYAVLPIYHPSPINPHGRDKNRNIFKKLSRKIKAAIR